MSGLCVVSRPDASCFRKGGVGHVGFVVGNYVRLLCEPGRLTLRSSVLYTESPVDCMNCLVDETRRP